MKFFQQLAVAAAVSVAAAPAFATDILFDADLDNQCTLAAPTNGSMEITADGLFLSSELTDTGVPASITVASIGASLLTIDAPSVEQTPTGYNSTGQIARVRYNGVGLLNLIDQPYTTESTSFVVPNISATVLTVNAQLENANSFVDGIYQLKTVVTCS